MAADLDPRKLFEVAPGLEALHALPFALPGAEGEVQPTRPPAAGADPRGAPPAAWAVGQGSIPGGTGAPGSFFLPFPGAASPIVPGEATGQKPPAAGLGPQAFALPTELELPPGFLGAGPPGGSPPEAPLPSAGVPSAVPVPPPATEPSTAPDLGRSVSTPGPAPIPATFSDPPPPHGAPVVGDGVGDGHLPGPDGTGGDGVQGATHSDGVAAEDLAADRIAADLLARIGLPLETIEHEPLQQANRHGVAPHLPTTNQEIHDLLAAALTPGLPAAGAEAPPAPASSETPSYYFLPPASEPPRVEPAEAEGFDPNVVRKDFPILDQEVHGKKLVWFDNAATTQKPRAVIDALSRFYERDNSNIHRGAHTLAARATDAYEGARDIVRRFLGASSPEEIVFVRGTTEAINLVAKTWGRKNVGAGDEIVLTQLEHHANIVPWQMLAQETGAALRVVPITDSGEVILEEYARLLGPRTKLVAVAQVSNALGTVVPVREMAAAAHRHGVPILIDGAQSVPHLRADVQEIGADFFVFSGHKIFAPTGIGVLYAKKEILEDTPPWQGGGSMIRDVTFERTTYADPPAKFEAGTPSIGDAVGLGAALEYLERLGIENVERYEHELLEYLTARLVKVPGCRLVGTAPEKVSVASFLLDGTRPEDVGRYLASEGIAVRAGHHCAQPTMQRYGISGTVRPSLALYNTREEVDRLIEALLRYRHRSH